METDEMGGACDTRGRKENSTQVGLFERDRGEDGEHH